MPNPAPPLKKAHDPKKGCASGQDRARYGKPSSPATGRGCPRQAVQSHPIADPCISTGTGRLRPAPTALVGWPCCSSMALWCGGAGRHTVGPYFGGGRTWWRGYAVRAGHRPALQKDAPSGAPVLVAHGFNHGAPIAKSPTLSPTLQPYK